MRVTVGPKLAGVEPQFMNETEARGVSNLVI